MPALSSAAWVAHDVSLAVSIGGALFGQAALHPALDNIADPDIRDDVSHRAWKRYGMMNLAAHAIVAATWFTGRSMLSGKEAGSDSRTLTVAKDACVVVAASTALASTLLGAWLGRKRRQGEGAERAKQAETPDRSAATGDRVINVLTTLNLAANVAVLGTTALLAMAAGKSPRFAITSRTLP